MYNILDVVANHMSYGSSIFLPAFNPFSDPEYFNNCSGKKTRRGRGRERRQAPGAAVLVPFPATADAASLVALH